MKSTPLLITNGFCRSYLSSKAQYVHSVQNCCIAIILSNIYFLYSCLRFYMISWSIGCDAAVFGRKKWCLMLHNEIGNYPQAAKLFGFVSFPPVHFSPFNFSFLGSHFRKKYQFHLYWRCPFLHKPYLIIVKFMKSVIHVFTEAASTAMSFRIDLSTHHH